MPRPKKDAAGVPIINVAEQLKARGIKQKAPIKTVQLRATQRGYYGVHGAVAELIDPETVFAFAVKDFQPAGSYIGRGTITVDGVAYELPTWCEDASTPIQRADEDDEADVYEDASDDVI